MAEYGLLVAQTSLVSVSAVDHISSLVGELQARDIHVDNPLDTGSLLAHENLPLILLQFVNRGLPRPSDGQIRLRQSPLRPDTTLGDIAGNRAQFAVSGLSFEMYEGQYHLVLNFG